MDEGAIRKIFNCLKQLYNKDEKIHGKAHCDYAANMLDSLLNLYKNNILQGFTEKLVCELLEFIDSHYDMIERGDEKSLEKSPTRKCIKLLN